MLRDMQEQENLLSKEKNIEFIKTEVPQLKTPKIVGKIDLDAINTKTKPKKKTRAELQKETEERIRIEKKKRQALKEARITKRKEIAKIKKVAEVAKNTEVSEVNFTNFEQEKPNNPAKKRRRFSPMKTFNKLICRSRHKEN